MRATWREIWGIPYSIPEYQDALRNVKTKRDRCAILASWGIKTGLVNDAPDVYALLTEMVDGTEAPIPD